jgi:hypothetical protein
MTTIIVQTLLLGAAPDCLLAQVFLVQLPLQ